MSHNQTIDGVSRKSLEQALKLAAVFDDGGDGSDAESARGVVWILRGVLDAPACSACNDTGRVHEPGCEPGACTACLEKPAAQPQCEPVAYDPAKENKQFEAWARTQSQVDLRLCDIGLYYERQTGLAHDAWQHRAKLADQPESVAVVPELTSELRWILGQMCFQHIHTAQALRLMGHEIARKAEDEQAVTIYWMLGHYLKDPTKWRQNATAELKASAPAA